MRFLAATFLVARGPVLRAAIARSLGLFALALVVLAAAACPTPAPVCGDGKRDDGEDESTCCLDAGCTSGACDATRGCLQPWQLECEGAGAGACMQEQPFLCTADVPSYSCADCGCPANGACVEGACLTAAVRDQLREGPIDDNLDVEDYPALFVELAAQPALTLVETQSRLLLRMREDARRGAFIAGVGSAAGGALAAAALAGVAPFTTSEEDPCAASALDERPLLIEVDVDRASKDTCFYPGLFGDCVSPHAEDCVLLRSRLPDAIIVLDADALLPELELALLRRAARSSPDTLDAFLDDVIGTFRRGADAFSSSPGFDVEVASETRQVRAYVSRRDESVLYLVMPRSGAKAYRLQSFRVLWGDAVTRAFMIDNDVRVAACEFSVSEAELVTIHCASDSGATVDATIDGATFDLTDVTTSP